MDYLVFNMSSETQMNSVDLDMEIDNNDANALIFQVLGDDGHLLQPNIEDNEQDEMHDDDLQLQMSPQSQENNIFEDLLSLMALNHVENTEQNYEAKHQPDLETSMAEYEPILKDCHKMHVKVYYQRLLIGRDNRGVDIVNKGGFVIFHKRCVQDPLPDACTPVSLPELNHGPELPDVKEKASRLTKRVLKDMEKGLQVYYNDGKIYAMRHCVSRVFVCCPTLNDTKSVKLEINVPKVVFDYSSYFKYLDGMSTNPQRLRKEKSPVIIFTFGQQWTKSYDLNNIYVRAHVTPVMAVDRLKYIAAGNWEEESIAKSLGEDDFERSEVGSVVSVPPAAGWLNTFGSSSTEPCGLNY